MDTGVRKSRGQRKQLDVFGLGIDPRDCVLPALREPGIPIRADDDAVRRGAAAEWNFLEVAGLRIETSRKPLLLFSSTATQRHLSEIAHQLAPPSTLYVRLCPHSAHT